ncbi:LysE family translocator [Arcicella lustrica]|uniref:LysE family translocator n=1 Tax=Arcicella lustrica TaxID=2984196 RepID=A0ABU5SIF5_9BACT|nr:LysE family translocator [Arcicella sp. DC25W]MEA5427077.1 LysE family translocator [Arcicella sp. DC25W]
MIPYSDLLIFIFAAFGLVITPGPNMIYLISRSISQGKQAGMISLAGVIVGFLFHVIMVSFGLTAILMAVPFAYTFLKWLGVGYLLYLAWNAIKPGSKSVFETTSLKDDSNFKLFQMGFLTNVLNPKIAVFYMSFFPQFIKPEYGNVLLQNFQLGFTQMTVSFSVNLMIVLFASSISTWFSERPTWIKIQKWFMAGILGSLAIKLALDKAK